MLHFQDQSAWLDTEEAIRLRQRYDGKRSKGLDGAKYMPLRDDAARRARSLDKRHKGNNTPLPERTIHHPACTDYSTQSEVLHLNRSQGRVDTLAPKDRPEGALPCHLKVLPLPDPPLRG